MKPSAKKIILDLLLGAAGQPLSARDAITSCAWFGISANNARVALTRLAAHGLIEAAQRGHYQLSAKAHELADDVATWRTAEQRVRAWNGKYLAAHCGGLSRSDRSALHRRHRALQMLGFRELGRGLFLRPDNIEGGVNAVRQRLYKLGLEPEAEVCIASDFGEACEARIHQLWDGAALNHSYQQQRESLQQWLARARTLDAQTAAREAFLLGGSAIRAVVFDPQLPAPLVDPVARRAFVEAVQQFDRAGQVLWRKGHAESRRRGP